MKSYKLVVLFLLLAGLAPAQNPEMSFRYLTQKDGLSSTFVNCLGQDSAGFIWIGTNNGLNRYDGLHFKTYWSRLADSTQLPHINITHIFTQRSGALWIGTIRGLAKYDNQRDLFERIKYDAVENGLNYQISDIQEDSNRQVFVSMGNSIYRVNETNHRLEVAYNVQDKNITKFLFDGEFIWLATQNGDLLIRIHATSGEMKRIRLSDALNQTLPSGLSIKSLVLRKGKLWIGAINGGIFSIDTHTLDIQRFMVNLPDADNTIFLYNDRQNQLWSIDYTGLKYFDDKTGVFYGYYPTSLQINSIKPGVSGFFQDNMNNYWVFHGLGGVGARIVNKGFRNFSVETPGLWHLSSNNVCCIGDDEQGNIWIGNDKPGIDVFIWKKGVIKSLYADNKPGSLGQGSVNIIRKDNEGRTWVGTYDGGLQLVDNEHYTFKRYVHRSNDSTSILGNDVRGIAPDANGNLWLVIHGKGVDKFNIKSSKAEHFTSENSNLSNPWANCLLYDKKGRLWVATSWGLSMLPKGEKRFKNYFFKDADARTVCSSNIITLREASDGTIWTGTDQGLCRYVEEDNCFENFSASLINKNICGIEEDNFGNLWVSTLRGLSRINPKDKVVFNFTEDDGMALNEYLPNSSFKAGDGVLFFGGINGVTYFNPANLRFNTTAPKAIINQVLIDNLNADSVENVTILKRNFGIPSLFKVGPQHRIVSISYAGISFNNPARNKYAVKLEGFDNQWQLVDYKTEMSYTNLDPGDYVFKVKVSNNDGYWGSNEATVKFTILPPFYSTWGFRLLGVGLIAFLLWIILLIRTRQLRSQRVLMAAEIRQKTDELVASNQELLAQAEYLDNINKLLEERQQKVESQSRTLALQTEVLRKNNRDLKQLNFTKDRLFSIIAHDLLNPFTSIMGLSEVFKENYNDMNDKERQEIASTIYLSSGRLFALLQNLLLWARSQTSSIKFDQTTFPILEIIKESTDYLQEQMQKKNQRFELVCDPVMCVYADVDMVKTVIRNLVNNAVKFTNDGGHIKIEVTKDDRFAYVVVSDNGQGMDLAKVTTLFDASNVHSTVGTAGEQGTGLGLLLCKEFVERNKGEIVVTSQKGKGSAFKFSLPLTAW